MHLEINVIHTPLQGRNNYSGVPRVGYCRRCREVNEGNPARELVERHRCSRPRRGYSFGQFPSLVRLEDHPMHAFINGLFDEHEQATDIDLFPIRETKRGHGGRQEELRTHLCRLCLPE